MFVSTLLTIALSAMMALPASAEQTTAKGIQDCDTSPDRYACVWMHDQSRSVTCWRSKGDGYISDPYWIGDGTTVYIVEANKFGSTALQGICKDQRNPSSGSISFEYGPVSTSYTIPPGAQFKAEVWNVQAPTGASTVRIEARNKRIDFTYLGGGGGGANSQPGVTAIA